MVAEEGEVIIEEEEPSVNKKKKGPISKLIGDLFEAQTDISQSNSTSPIGKPSRELELYKTKQPVKNLDLDPLIWWKSRELVYPLMYKLDCFVATSIPSERPFSSSGNVISSNWSRLTPEHAN